MDSPDLRSAVSRVVMVMKKVTRVVQLAPFAYLLLYTIYLFTEVFFPCDTLFLIDELTAVGQMVCIGILIVGRLLRLCAWFRSACLIPLSSKIENFIDCYVFQFTQDEVLFINILIGILTILFIAAAFRHFYYGR